MEVIVPNCYRANNIRSGEFVCNVFLNLVKDSLKIN